MVDAGKVQKAMEMLREHNQAASIVTTPCSQLTGEQLLEIIEKPDTMAEDLMREVEEHRRHHHHGEDGESCGCEEHGHHHHHGEDSEGCGCEGHGHHEHHHHGEDGEGCGCESQKHHHHHHGEDGEGCGCEDHEHHHHGEDGEGCSCEDHGHHHEHHHDHDGECGCGCHDHDHHHADEVFSSWGMENVGRCERKKLEEILDELANGNAYGDVLRAKGMVPGENGDEWYYFDLVPDEFEIRLGKPDYTGKVCVIGARLREEELNKAFGRS